MNAHVAPAQAMNFRARSLLAFVLEPTRAAGRMVCSARRLARPFAQFLRLEAGHPRNGRARTSASRSTGIFSAISRAATSASWRWRTSARTLVLPHLPPVVTGGRPVNAPAALGGRRAAGDPARQASRKAELADHRRKRALRPVDRSSRRRRDSRWPRRLGRGDRRRRIGACLWRAAGPRDRRDLGFALSAHLLQGGARRTHLHRRRRMSRPKPWTRGSRAAASRSDWPETELKLRILD